MNAKRVLFAVVSGAILYPLVYCIFAFATWQHGQIAESSIYSLRLGQFFHDILFGRSVFNGGNYTVYPLNYFIIYAGVGVLERIFSGIPSYLLFVSAFDLVAFYFFVKLALLITDDNVEGVSLKRYTIICLLGLLYLTSLSNFNFIKSNIVFLLPYLALPPLLYYATRYAREGERRHLLLFLLFSLTLGDFNLAHAAILILTINIFLIVQNRMTSIARSVLLRRMAGINITLLPALLFLLIIVADNVFYSANLSTFAIVAAENMYSNNAQYLNIFAQTTDWGLFGMWNHALYYHFSPFYRPGPITIFALLPFVLLAIAAASSRKTLITRRLAIPLLIFMLVVFQIMLGNNNAVYHFLYQHLLVFQVFRNITKLAPLLFFLLVFTIYAFLYDGIREPRRFWAAALLIVASLVYNAPYWSYARYIYGHRAIEGIPRYWQSAADYINSNTSGYDRVLALPAIYVNDVYYWKGRKTWVQGSLLDILIKDQSFRLSERAIGPPQYQADADSVFVKSATSIRHLDANYSRLTWLAKKYGFDYVVLSRDLLSEYERTSDIQTWLRHAGYRKMATFGPVSIYRNPAFFKPPFAGAALAVRRINNLRYDVHVLATTKSRTLTFDAPFHPGWHLVADPSNPPLCTADSNRIAPNEVVCGGNSGGSILGELRHLFMHDSTAVHYQTSDGTNGWIFPQELQRGMTFSLYFKPQAIFYIVVIVSVLAFFVFFGYFVVDIARSDRRPLKIDHLAAVSLLVWLTVALVAWGVDARARQNDDNGFVGRTESHHSLGILGSRHFPNADKARPEKPAIRSAT